MVSVRIVSTFFPSNSKIISPAFIPALSAGLFSETLATRAPSGFSNFSNFSNFFCNFLNSYTNHPLLVSPNLINCLITLEAGFDGIAKPIPIEPEAPGAIIAVFIPTTFPFKSKSGPPEFP